jgi:hypothetical protein
METNRYALLRLLSILVLLCAFLLVACRISVPTPTSDSSEAAETNSPEKQIPNKADVEWVLNALLLESDLPEGWFQNYFGVDEEKGDTVYTVGFYATDKPGHEYINVTQRGILYENEVRAKKPTWKSG